MECLIQSAATGCYGIGCNSISRRQTDNAAADIQTIKLRIAWQEQQNQQERLRYLLLLCLARFSITSPAGRINSCCCKATTPLVKSICLHIKLSALQKQLKAEGRRVSQRIIYLLLA